MNFQLFVTLLQFLAVALLMATSSYLLVRYGLKRFFGADFYLCLLFAFLVIAQVLTSLAGLVFRLNLEYLLLFSALLFLICLLLKKYSSPLEKPEPLKSKKNEEGFNLGRALILVTTMLLGVALATALRFGPVRHDVLTYHLFFPARWVQQQSIFYVPTLFGDLSHTYAPSSGMAFFAFLSIPFHSDILSRAGQFPFLIMGALAIYLLCIKIGASKTGASIALTPALLSPVIFRQGFSAQEDLAMGACFVTALYFLWKFKDEPSFKGALLLGAAFGFAIGIKFIALTFSLLLIAPFAIFIIQALRKKPLVATGYLVIAFFAAVATGGFWLIRNLVNTGNPLFPLDLPFLFDGLYSRAAMLKSAFHISRWQFVPLVWIHAYGFWMAILAAVAIIGAITLVLIGRVKGFAGYVILMPIFVTLVGFILIPYNSQYRFLIPAVLLTFLPFGLLEQIIKIRWPLRIFWMTITLAGLLGLFHPINAGGVAITKSGLLPIIYLPYLAILAGIGLVAYFAFRRFSKSFLVITISVFTAIFITTLVMEFSIFKKTPKQIIAVRQNLSTNYPINGWLFINNIQQPLTVAYTGTNVPYYLLGRDWRHKVVYANVAGKQGYLLHDFFRKCQAGGTCPTVDLSDKPPLIRNSPDFDLWITNLFKKQADFLFISALAKSDSQFEIKDAQNFPIERKWADEHPEIFKFINGDKSYRIYTIDSAAISRNIKN